MRRRRAPLRARRRHGDVRRQPQHQRLEHLHRSGARSAGSGSRAGRRTPTSTPRRSSRSASRGGRVRRHRDLHAVRDPPRLGPRGLREVAAGGQASRAADPPARVLADGGRAHVRRQRALAARTCSSGCARPGWARRRAPPPRCSHDGVRERISPNKLPVARWVEIIEASHAEGIRSTVTVMFGHVEEPWELAEHMRVVRELQERTGGFTEFVPLSFIPFHTLLGRTHGVEEISREENLKHTAAFRLALGQTIRNLQASWVKMGLDAATESLRWGVNDLGGTLMEESISRMAGSYHGVRLEPPDLVAAAHRAGRPAAERTTLYEILRRYDAARRPRRERRPADHRPAALAVRGRRAARGVRRAARRHRHAHRPDRVLRPDLRGDLPPDHDAPSGDLHGRRGAPAGPRDRLLRHPVRPAFGDPADARQHADRAARAARGQGRGGVRADRGGGPPRVRAAARDHHARVHPAQRAAATPTG